MQSKAPGLLVQLLVSFFTEEKCVLYAMMHHILCTPFSRSYALPILTHSHILPPRAISCHPPLSSPLPCRTRSPSWRTAGASPRSRKSVPLPAPSLPPARSSLPPLPGSRLGGKMAAAAAECDVIMAAPEGPGGLDSDEEARR